MERAKSKNRSLVKSKSPTLGDLTHRVVSKKRKEELKEERDYKSALKSNRVTWNVLKEFISDFCITTPNICIIDVTDTEILLCCRKTIHYSFKHTSQCMETFEERSEQVHIFIKVMINLPTGLDPIDAKMPYTLGQDIFSDLEVMKVMNTEEFLQQIKKYLN